MRESCLISFSVSFATVGRIVCAHRMEVLRNLFGKLTAGIIRLLVTVGLLAAVYFFVVRPALDKTEKISHEVGVNVQRGLKEAHIGKTIDSVNREVQREIKKTLRHSPSHSAADKLIRCIQRAHQNVQQDRTLQRPLRLTASEAVMRSRGPLSKESRA